MSECVVRMEMPKRCEYCPMCRLYRENGRVWCNAANRILKQEWKNPDWTELDIPKPDWCPIICQLPEGHGDLVDKDEMYKKSEAFCNQYRQGEHDCEKCNYIVAQGYMYKSPTIVPAERKDNGETC